MFTRQQSRFPVEEKRRRLGSFQYYDVYGAKVLVPRVEMLALGNAVAALAPDNKVYKDLLAVSATVIYL